MSTKGWLPYGSNDSSVLLQIPLTAETDVTGLATATGAVTASGGVFDSVLGYNPKGAGTLSIIDLVDHATLDTQGQLSLEVSRAYACRLDAATWSNGDAAENSSSFISLHPNTGTASSQMITKGSAGQMQSTIFGALNIANVYSHTAGKSDFVTLRIGWHGGANGGRCWYSIDDLDNGDLVRGSADPSWTGIFKRIYIGSNKAVNFFVKDSWCRNLQISNEAPMLPMQKNLSKVAILSDSMFNSAATTSGTATGDYRDATTIFTMKRELGKLGIRMGDVYSSINGGYAISSIPANSLADKVADVVAQNPSIPLYRGGTNDVINSGVAIDATWESELKADLTSLLAASSVKAIVIGTVPSTIGNSAWYTDVIRAKTAAANAIIEALPDWDSRVYVADCYNKLGGESPEDETYIGQASGAYDDLHFAGVGHYKHGVAYFEALIRAMSQ
jgi:hypothetical protein